MLYSIDTDKMAANLMPWFKRKIAWFLAYVKSVLNPIGTVNAMLVTFTDSITEFLRYTGQHKALVELLNNNFDSSLRRITIQENNIAQIQSLTFYKTGEVDAVPKTFYQTGEANPNPITIYKTGESQQTNFTVIFPAGLTYVESQVRSLLDSYVECSRTYNIITL